MHLEEAGILRAGPGGPDQQWPTVSSATPGKDPKSLSSCVGSSKQSDDLFVFKTRNINGSLFSLSSFPYMYDILTYMHDYFSFLLNVLQELKTVLSVCVAVL